MGMHRNLNHQVWVIAGAECSGKTTLFENLRNAFPFYSFVSEYNRSWLEERNKTAPFSHSDLVHLFDDCLAYYENLDMNRPAIMDSDMLNLFLWASHIHHPKANDLYLAWSQTHFNYLLCSPEIPYVSDPLRSGTDIRQWSWDKHLEYMKTRHHFVLKSNDALSKLIEAKEIILSAE
jgi:nicotinamide riboside kinase